MAKAHKKSRAQDAEGSWKSQSSLLFLGLLLLLSFIVLKPGPENELVNWDDDVNIYDNPLAQDLTIDNIKEIFTSDVIGNYNPLPILTFAIESQLYEEEILDTKNATPYVLFNVILHLLCVFFVFRLSWEMGLPGPVVFIATALFALHPMRVESISWATERKDVLYGVFFLSALWCYVRHIKTESIAPLIAAGGLMVLSCLSKIQAVSLPLAMLAIDHYMRPRPHENVLSQYFSWIYQKLPFFFLSLVTGTIGIISLRGFGSLEQPEIFNFAERLVIGSFSLTVYLIKSLVPYEMVPLYPYPASLTWMHWLSIAGGVGFLSLLVWSYTWKKKLYFTGLFFFIVNIVFLLQIVGAGQGYLADRFSYIAYLGLFWVYGYGIYQIAQWKPQLRTAVYLFTLLIVMVYGWMSFRQKQIWQNSETLWTHVISHYDRTAVPFRNRGNHFRDNGRYTEALSDYTTALKLVPDDHKLYNSRAKLYFQDKKTALALADYNQAIYLSPASAEYYANRGAAHAQKGAMRSSLEDLNTALDIDPTTINALLNRSVVWFKMGELAKSEKDLAAYLDLNPRNEVIQYEHARRLAQLGRYQDALIAANKAIKLDNRKGEHYALRAQLHHLLGNQQKARKDITTAKQLGAELNQELVNKINK